LLLLFPYAGLSCPDEVRVHYTEGLARGFLALMTEDGTRIAEGEESQVLRNGVVTSRLTFRFYDGSIYDDETKFTQHGTYKLLSDHVIQKGPTFPTQMETWLDTTTGQVKVNSSKNGKPETINQTLDLPSDLANGIVFTIVKSMLSTPQATVSYIAFTPKPNLVKLVITQEGRETMRTDRAPHPATRFLIKVDLGGIAGAVATVVGKKPADTHLWVISGTAPTFAGSEGPLYGDGPVWKIELDSPRWESAH
jgi:hypothetical protein